MGQGPRKEPSEDVKDDGGLEGLLRKPKYELDPNSSFSFSN